jgi:hypothetical protein
VFEILFFVRWHLNHDEVLSALLENRIRYEAQSPSFFATSEEDAA